MSVSEDIDDRISATILFSVSHWSIHAPRYLYPRLIRRLVRRLGFSEDGEGTEY